MLKKKQIHFKQNNNKIKRNATLFVSVCDTFNGASSHISHMFMLQGFPPHIGGWEEGDHCENMSLSAAGGWWRYLDGEGVEVVQHHMVWLWKQCRVTLWPQEKTFKHMTEGTSSEKTHV